jgi:hypothetical protein
MRIPADESRAPNGIVIAESRRARARLVADPVICTMWSFPRTRVRIIGAVDDAATMKFLRITNL